MPIKYKALKTDKIEVVHMFLDWWCIHCMEFESFINSVYLLVLIQTSSALVDRLFFQVTQIIVIIGDKGLSDML